MRTWVRGALAVVLVAVTAGCGTDAPPAPVTSAPVTSDPAPGPTSAGTPEPGSVRETGVPLDESGTGERAGALLPAAGARVDTVSTGDGARTFTVTAAPGVVAWVAPPPGGRTDVQTDGSVTVHDDAGTVVAALAAPAAPDGTSGTWRLTGDVLALDTPAGAASFVVGTAAVESATWGDADGGRSLLVVPAGWVRRGSLAAQYALVSQVALAEPEAASAPMQAQLWCHVLGAPDKASWNVEPWRPDVPTTTMLLTACNPTDADL